MTICIPIVLAGRAHSRRLNELESLLAPNKRDSRKP